MATAKTSSSSDTAKQGSASMDKEKQRDDTPGTSKESGGNFKNDPERAAKAGKKGGEASHGGRSSSADSSKGSEANRSTGKKGESGSRS